MFVTPMAENLLPVDLDYTDMWLPSDSFLDAVGGVKTSRHVLNRQISCLDVDSLAEHLSVFALASSNPRFSKQALGFERFKLPAYSSSNLMSPGNVFVANSGCVDDGTRVRFSTVHPASDFSVPVRELGLSKPSQNQVESYLQQLKRARILQRQQSLFRQQSLLRNRVLPVERSTINPTAENYSRGSCGTGVFHPLSVKYSVPNRSAATSSAGSMKKLGSRNSATNKMKLIQQKTYKPRQAKVIPQKDDCYYHLPPDMGFSKDWTY